MSEATTRRGFLTTAGVVAAAGAALAVAPGSSGATAVREDVALPTGAAGPMAAYIHDVKKGEVALMVEGHEVMVTDKQLVARLASAFAKAGRG
ncbi:MAG: twin-arginine translocation signal domain-containing protein [Actinobacteria bacterium]|nr:twin-arginine translocation signal domain-containing protein [Actinomycetota bacterium]